MTTHQLRAVPDPRRDRLVAIAHELEKTGWAFELVDAEWRVAWLSEQLRLTVGETDEHALGLGEHVLITRKLPAWDGMITTESEDEWMRVHLPFLLDHDPAILDRIPPEFRERAPVVTPSPAPPVWTYEVRFARPEGAPSRVSCLGLALREGGDTLGYALFYGPSLPASLLALVLRGDEAQFTRMARLMEPRRTEAAILFADLEASSALSRRLPSRAFFGFMQALAGAMDEEVLSRSGIIGKHAGDGLTAFFTADDLGSPADAALAALEAARAIAAAVPQLAAAFPAADRVLAERGFGLNAGLHWGSGLYMGQLVTGGRLEVTALGDEVNECARMEQSATGGALLASKALLERLDDAAARDLGLDPSGVVYCALAELPGAGEKAKRDAGGIPVADVALPGE